MLARAITLFVTALALSGCDLLDLMLPRRATTPLEARNALERCGVSPDAVAWRVTKNGSFVFGRKTADATPIAEPRTACLLAWAKRNRVNVVFMGWEMDQ
jgi:hypothetical protein